VIQAAAANFFRPSAPNYFLVQGTHGTSAGHFHASHRRHVADARYCLAVSDRSTPRCPTGNSKYNAMNLDLKKRFSHNFQFLASYTWSHSIDDFV